MMRIVRWWVLAVLGICLISPTMPLLITAHAQDDDPNPLPPEDQALLAIVNLGREQFYDQSSYYFQNNQTFLQAIYPLESPDREVRIEMIQTITGQATVARGTMPAASSQVLNQQMIFTVPNAAPVSDNIFVETVNYGDEFFVRLSGDSRIPYVWYNLTQNPAAFANFPELDPAALTDLTTYHVPYTEILPSQVEDLERITATDLFGETETDRRIKVTWNVKTLWATDALNFRQLVDFDALMADGPRFIAEFLEGTTFTQTYWINNQGLIYRMDSELLVDATISAEATGTQAFKLDQRLMSTIQFSDFNLPMTIQRPTPD